ncbi:MAG: YihY family inner membrane protein, partial [Cytophagaceae bacterium]
MPGKRRQHSLRQIPAKRYQYQHHQNAFYLVGKIVHFAVVFGVLSAFPVFDEWSRQLTDYVFSNFVPSAASSLSDKIEQYSVNARGLTITGVIALVVSLLITLNSVESTFNQIWRVGSSRPRLGRFLVYWTVLTLGAMVAAASLAISARFYALPVFATTGGHLLQTLSINLAPVLIELGAITAIYRVVPHRTIKLRYALAGAIVATLLLELIKWG